MHHDLNINQTKFLEELLQTSSIETLSTGLCSVLLHSAGLDPKELLTASLIYLGLSIEHTDSLDSLLSVKKSVIEEAVATYIHCSNVLTETILNSETPGSEVMVEDGAILEGLFPPEGPNPT